MQEDEQKLLDAFWDAKHEAMLEAELKENEALRQLFAESPEKKEMYKLKIIDSEGMHIPEPTCIRCKTCAFRLAPGTVGGQITERYTWGYCQMLEEKPHEVMYEGAECIFYEKD